MLICDSKDFSYVLLVLTVWLRSRFIYFQTQANLPVVQCQLKFNINPCLKLNN
jgi:hypothetical protein